MTERRNPTAVDDEIRFSAAHLEDVVAGVLTAEGVRSDMATAMARQMVAGDLYGHRTHGVALLDAYVEQLQRGTIAVDGRIEVVHDDGGSLAWRTKRTPGAWVMEQAVQTVLSRISSHAVVTVSVGGCSHLGCLQSYLRSYVQHGLVVLLTVTDPGVRSVAPPGSADPVITTNPIAMGFPTRTEPVLLDICTSVASNGYFRQAARRGEALRGPWLIDAQGRPTTDPSVLDAQPPGSIAPLGAPEHGYKGFALGLMVEVLALSLSGFGRRLAPEPYGQGVFLQVIDPRGFAGLDDFLDETDELVRAARAARPAVPGEAIRLPGERAQASRRDQMANGVVIEADVYQSLCTRAAAVGVEVPTP